MKSMTSTLILLLLFSLVVTCCVPEPPVTPTFPAATQPSPPTPTATTMPEGISIIVNNHADEGPGSFRQALNDAQPGDTLLFDPATFSPESPATITLESSLPPLDQGYITIDASDAGVILDGSLLAGNSAFGLDIISSGNTIQGLELVNFSGYAIGLFGGAQDNLIGGDPLLGDGPNGQGNSMISNGVGINIWDPETTHNTIMGNFIGTDAQDQAGLGNGTGIYLQEASHHMLGPGNTIAHNWEIGIAIAGSSATGNTITRNDIRANARFDICLQNGGNLELQPPMIAGFDLAAGRVMGFTCAACTVEVFSAQGHGILMFEGSAEADAEGFFGITNPTPFQGESLTLTATDPAGNTSSFAQHTTGDSQLAALQSNNDNPLSRFVSMPADQLDDNRIGDMSSLHDGFDTTEAANLYLATSNSFGLTHKRLSLDYFDWSEVIEADPPAYSRFEVNPVHDQLITDFVESGVTLHYGLVFWDDQIEPVSTGYARFRDEAEIERYLEYARFIVRHFKGRIDYYEILNETFFSEFSHFSQQNIEVSDYIEVVRRVVEVIHAEDPEAKVIVGSAPGIFDRDCAAYQFAVLSSDEIMPIVDAVAWHMGSYPMPFGGPISYLYQVPETLVYIESTAREHGFTGEFIAEELGWPTEHNPSPSTPWFMFSEILAAKYYGRSILEHQARGHITSLAGLAYEAGFPKMTVISNLATLLDQAEPVSLDISLDSSVDNIDAYAFEYNDGGLMLALWLDGFASDTNGIAVSTTVTLPEITASEVTGVDILFSIEQLLRFDQTTAGLKIPDVLVRDYPIILRIATEPSAQP
ncbi:MAG TPA: hypothetical protein G4O08_01630 [Anaerolineae bacterium]|nr:hypothetical protein [Anaerolineae bacterium]